MWRGLDERVSRILPFPKPRARGAPAAVACLLAALLAGCKQDDRISIAELQAREKELRQTEPVPIRSNDLALTELRPYVVGPGDVLLITMMGLTDAYSQTLVKVRVHSEGQIELPQVGPIKVAGLSLQQVEEAVMAAHVPQYVKVLSVFAELVGPEATTVMVAGGAAHPGLVSLQRNQRNILYALASAGGFGGTASSRVRVRPIRPEEEELVYDLADVNDVRRAMTARPLESGDIVTVEGAPSSAVYVTGLVNLPGPVLVPPDSSVSVLHAVYACGGLRDLLDPVEATLVRTLPDGKRAQVKLDLAGILAGKEPDVALRAGDILTVPHTTDTRLREWAINNLRVGPFSVGVAYDPLAQYNVHRALNEDNSFGRSIQQTLQYGIPNLLVPQVPIPGTAP
jgi:protein involved in polysaccharide export with SLBB domain